MRAKDGVGHYGERVALAHLEADGFEVLERNWRCAEGEIDLIAVDPKDGALVFVEVKTRSTIDYGVPAEAVSWRKARRIRVLAGRWLAEHDRFFSTVRFDVVAVLRQPRGAAIVEHLREAF